MNILDDPSSTAIAFSDEIRVYPNPVNDLLYIQYANDNQAYYISDINGRQLKVGRLENGQSNVSVSDLPAGCYILSIENAAKKVKFVKLP